MESHKLWEHYHLRRHWGELEKPTDAGVSRYPRCGDRLELQVRVEDGRITAVAYKAWGCAAAVAAGSAGTHLVLGLPVDQAQRLNAFEMDAELGGLLPSKRHAILMFLDCLGQCIGARTETSS